MREQKFSACRRSSVDLLGSFGGIRFALNWSSCCISRCNNQQVPIPCFLFSLCICQSRPHLLLHSAGFSSVLYQSRWQCLCLPPCYWLQPRSRCPLSAHFRAGGGVLSTGRHAPWWAERVQENEMSPHRSLTGFQHELPGEQMPPLNKSAPLLQIHSTSRGEVIWSNPSFSLFCHFETRETSIHISAQFCLFWFKRRAE